ncbi:MAG: hypothetical protein N4A46_15770 [Schleiferiaceae bacterium]|jgi:predicted  nucleic acid-binding Zn-ribbon protein|nr:hypothetical protein [Schleiferiaceae bacterium]
MQDLHHTYESLHKEHHAWRKDLITVRNDLNMLSEKITKAKTSKDVGDLESKLKWHHEEVSKRLENLTQADMLMNENKDKNHVVSQKLFAINSKMRQDLIKFDTEFEKFKDVCNSL